MIHFSFQYENTHIISMWMIFFSFQYMGALRYELIHLIVYLLVLVMYTYCNMLVIQFLYKWYLLHLQPKKSPSILSGIFFKNKIPLLLYLWKSVSYPPSVFVIDLSFALTFTIGGIFPGRGSFSYNRSSPRYDAPWKTGIISVFFFLHSANITVSQHSIRIATAVTMQQKSNSHSLPGSHSLYISTFSLHFLSRSPFPHSLPISSQPGCQAAAGCDSLQLTPMKTNNSKT